MTRINWKNNELLKAKLRDYILDGYTSPQISEILSKELHADVSVRMVENAVHRFRFSRNNLEKFMIKREEKIRIYQELTLPDDNYMISCDEHAPYHSEAWINRKLAIAEKFKIKKNIQIGDTLDFDFLKKHPILDGEEETGIKKEELLSIPVIKALSYFDENFLLRGNHEWRVSRYTNGKIQAQHLYKIFGDKEWNKKFKYSTYDKMNIGKKWMVVHPQSYSQIATSVAKRLAEKFHRNIINSHGHLIGMAYDRSGKFLAVDLGGMFDKAKVGYINLQTTSHPSWKNGFGMLYNGHFYHFTPETDFNYWLK